MAALLLVGCTAAASGRSRAVASVRPTHRITSPVQLGIASSGLHISLSPDACIEEPPTAADRHQVVFVDAGHGGVDPGAEGTAPGGVLVSEKSVTLGVALVLAQLLRAHGFTVVLSRTADTLVADLPEQDLNSDGSLTPDGFRADLEARVACANSAHAAALVAVHFNDFDDPTAAGSQAFYDPDRPFAHSSLQLAQEVEAGLIGQFQSHGWNIPDRGIQTDTTDDGPALTPADAAYGHFIELGPFSKGVANVASNMPGTLVEPLFLTNPGEAAVAASPAGQQGMAAGLLQGISTYLGA